MPKRSPKNVKRVRRAKRSSKRPSFTKKVKAVVQSFAEHKQFTSYGGNNQIGTASASFPSSLNLMPVLNQGTGDSTRVGNEVRITSANIRGYVNILPYNVSTNVLSTAVMVKIWLCSYKTAQTNNISLTNADSSFFEINNGSVGMQGTMLDMVLQPNMDSWTVHASKKVKIGAGYASSTGPVGTSGYFDNSPMTAPFSFNWGKYCKSPLRFNDATTSPSNKNMFLIFQSVYADGSASSVYSSEMHYCNTVKYVDI